MGNIDNIQPSALNLQRERETVPIISIVTPSYNQGAFLAETIRSVIGQEVNSSSTTSSSMAVPPMIPSISSRPMAAYLKKESGK